MVEYTFEAYLPVEQGVWANVCIAVNNNKADKKVEIFIHMVFKKLWKKNG
jgi:hypothetical protein